VSESKGELVAAGQGGLGRVGADAYTPRSVQEAKALGELAARSGLFANVRSPEAAAIILMTGVELGLSGMQALRGIHIVEGKPVLSADLLVALCKRSPLCAYFRLVESTHDRATYETQRHGDPQPTPLTWTMEDARRAKLTGRGNWMSHPAAMLRARCGAALARAVYPDLVLGLYEESEGEEIREGARRPAPVREVAPAPAIEAEEAEIVYPDPVALLEDNINNAVLASSPSIWKECVKQFRSLGLSEGNPERTRLNGLLAEAKEKIAAAQPAPTPRPPAAPALEPGADDEPFSDPTSALPPATVPASSPVVAPAPRSKAWHRHADDLTDLARLGKNACSSDEKGALDAFLHALLGAETGEAVAAVEGSALKTRWSEKGEAVVAQLLSLHRDFLGAGKGA
jgi:hypothetical protein